MPGFQQSGIYLSGDLCSQAWVALTEIQYDQGVPKPTSLKAIHLVTLIGHFEAN
jgi:hypothetical protein